MVHDYNHWKVGVDVFDQYMTYLMCDFRCLHTWMPLMIQALMTMRVNSYREHVFICPSHRSHKEFTLMWIKCLMKRGVKLVSRTRMKDMQTHSPSRHFRFSSKNPTLPDVCHSTDVTHTTVLVKRQGKCIHCRYKYMCAKIENPDVDPVFWGIVRQPQRKCVECGFYLCKSCWDDFHS